MKKAQKVIVPKLNNENLDRFAGSSDEEEQEKPGITPASAMEASDRDSDNDKDDGDSGIGGNRSNYVNSKNENQIVGNHYKNDDGVSSAEEDEEVDMGTKMANAMSKILETSSKPKIKRGNVSSSVVLANTVTPLQRLQQKEKEERKSMKEKRQANRERNLTALHLPLSIATTNSIDSGGKLSVANELEQERFHRRVATRGVVALFNAITQHQKSNSVDSRDFNLSPKTQEISKMTKHGFLDKIKAAAKTNRSDEPTNVSKDGTTPDLDQGTNKSSWSALQDDYMLDPKKNWDEESSEDDTYDLLDSEDGKAMDVSKSRKRRRISDNQ